MMQYYWRCPECGGYSQMGMVCEKCAKKRSLSTVTEQTSGTKNATKSFNNYTAHKGVLSSA